MSGSRSTGPAFLAASPEGQGARDLVGDGRRIDLVGRPADERRPEVRHREAGHDARLHGLPDAVLDVGR